MFSRNPAESRILEGQPMTLMPVFIAAALLLAAVFLLIRARDQRRLGGLPDGDLIYTDNVAGDCPILVSHRYGLKGKPDALVRTGSGDLVPVERKKTLAPRNRPYDGDLIQATAYCILVEEEFGRAPPFMRIQYADRWFDEPYTAERKQWVLETCARLRQARRGKDCRRSHRIAAKCRNCGQRPNCGEAL
jgi:CRISPR-associated exonuclease Cas4